jgi:hypothetical protein
VWEHPPKWLKVEGKVDHTMLWRDAHKYIERHDDELDILKAQLAKVQEEKYEMISCISALESSLPSQAGLATRHLVKLDSVSNQLRSLQFLVASILLPVVRDSSSVQADSCPIPAGSAHDDEQPNSPASLPSLESGWLRSPVRSPIVLCKRPCTPYAFPDSEFSLVLESEVPPILGAEGEDGGDLGFLRDRGGSRDG